MKRLLILTLVTLPLGAQWGVTNCVITWDGSKLVCQASLPGPLVTLASSSSAAGFNVPVGTAPTSPGNGDIWNAGASLFFRSNAPATRTFAFTSGTLTSGNCAKFDSSGNVVDAGSACNTFDPTVANTLTNVAAPATPGSGFVKVWADSTDTRFHDKNASGTIGTTVVADTGAANNFLTAISAAGVISKAQPSCSSLSNAAASCSTDATNASNISSGLLAIARGGTNAATSGAYTFFGNSTNSSAAPAFATVTSINSQSGAGYTVVNGDYGKLITVSNASPQTLTLPSTAPAAGWWIHAQNTGAGAWTVSRNGLNIDGAASNLTLTTAQGVIIWSDGSNYFTSRGLGAIADATLTSGQLVTGNGKSNVTVGNLSGDVTTAGSTATTVAKVNGVSYPSGPAVNTAPLVTASNTVTYSSLDIRQFVATASATASNTTTETSLFGAGQGTRTISGNTLSAGNTIRVTVRGYLSTDTTPQGFRIKVKLGSTVILDTYVNTLSAGIANGWFEISGTITARTTGASGTAIGAGQFEFYSAPATQNGWQMVNTATTTIDTTSSITLDCTATWSTASANNSITGSVAFIEVL